ncbi:unnamed protein product [marine sediment metagenome]|uniref:GIY-YIG domain-containing protein n=1 Tax=marine sediment metagenome TaxID=412755 RepID=X1V316_9ZZZZ
MLSYSVYILQNPEGKLYIGQTENLEDRLKRNNEGRSRSNNPAPVPWDFIILMPDFTLYILRNLKGKFYIGQTSNLEERLTRHNTNRPKYTRNKGPWTLVYQKSYPTRAEAMKREKQLKKWRRELLLKLIDQR